MLQQPLEKFYVLINILIKSTCIIVALLERWDNVEAETN